MIVTIIIGAFSLAGIICGLWGLGEAENICNYDYIGEDQSKL